MSVGSCFSNVALLVSALLRVVALCVVVVCGLLFGNCCALVCVDCARVPRCVLCVASWMVRVALLLSYCVHWITRVVVRL